MFMWSQCMALHMRSWRRTLIFSAVCFSKSWLSIRCFTCAFSNDAFNGLRQVSLGFWPLLDDGVHCKEVEEGRESWSDRFSTSTEKKAIISSSTVIPDLFDVVANIVRAWPFIVSYLKEIGGFVVRSPSFEFYCHCFVPMYRYCWCLEELDGWVLLSRPARSSEVPSSPHAAWKT